MNLFDTLTRQIKPLGTDESEIKLYICGLTVYDEMHLGHARGIIVSDVLVRWLKHTGRNVKLVRNFTDIDDRIIKRANDEGVPFHEITQRYIKAASDSMDELNVMPADVEPRATEHIPQIIDMVASLIEQGYAYVASDGVYFSVFEYMKRGGEYGVLSGRAVDDMLSGDSENVERDKKTPHDFALWKASSPNEPSWSSPWGDGRPGWHIECSAMALEHLGPQCDIHGGGLDLVFPHHENELAQSQAALSVKPFAKHWMHNGLLNLPDNTKMSKSLGNSLFVKDALTRNSADAIRYWVLQSHYRSPMVLNLESLAAAELSMERLGECLNEVHTEFGEQLESEQFWLKFSAALDNDLNTPAALSVLFDLRRAIKNAQNRLNVSESQKCLRTMCDVLGLQLNNKQPGRTNYQLSDEEVEMLIAERTKARLEKQFENADKLRRKLLANKVQVFDSKTGTQWKRI